MVSSISSSEMGKEAIEGGRQESADAQVRQHRKEWTDRERVFILHKGSGRSSMQAQDYLILEF